MRKPIITLLTDFGTHDHYVASMKGIILGINPRCTLVDITHQVNPHDIKEGAFILANAYSSFPKRTIHLSVVDPGVGGSRKPILLVTSNYFFVGPDNGLFTLALQREKVKQAVALTNPKFFLPRVTDTFHGRDIFAPVAAYLSSGIKPKDFGNEIDSWTGISFKKPRMRGRELIGEILHIDTFGNLISNINEEILSHFVKDHSFTPHSVKSRVLTRGSGFTIRAGKRVIQGLKKGYWEGKRNEVMALFGSGGFLEISVREGSAQKMLKAKIGDQILISTKFQINSKQKYLEFSPSHTLPLRRGRACPVE